MPIPTVAMYPTKSMLDYMTEMQRLFPEQKDDDDVRGLPRLYSNQTSLFNSPTHQPTMANHSSSSADSTSPETFPDLSQHILARRQRPIIGRKIIGSAEKTPPKMPISRSYESDFELSPPNPTWHQEDLNLFSMPPRGMQYTPNVYELFPENKDVDFKSPITYSFQPNVSPSSSYAPSHSSTSCSNYSPNKFQETPPRSHQPRFQPPKMAPTISYLYPNQTYRPTEVSGQKMCTFCRKNGEAPMVYMDHAVRGKSGNRNIVTCPILRSHVCSTCGGTGDNAHTITYCPVLRSHNNGQPLQSTTITLKNTRIKSNGKRRY